MKTIARLSVYLCSGKYYATIHFPNSWQKYCSDENRIFFVEKEIDCNAEGLKSLQEAAKQEARKRNLEFVINLDD